MTKQVQDVLESKLRIGYSKHEDKKQGISDKYIYAWQTFKTYLRQGCKFVKWAQNEHGCKTLIEARPYVNTYLQKHIDEGLSSYTQKTVAAALAKLYGCSAKDFIKTADRRRADITRSRGEKVRDKHFSEKRNKVFVDFCKATGLRRHEIKALTRNHLEYDRESKSYFLNIKGKGGLHRRSPVLSMAVVERIRAADGKVWPNVPNGADIHAYRGVYAAAVYRVNERPITNIPRRERYYCRGDYKGLVLDKKAMAIASEALGHSRIDVISGHYLHTLKG